VITMSDLRIAVVLVSRVKAGSLIITAGRLHLVGGRISSSTMLIGSFIVDIRSDLHSLLQETFAVSSFATQHPPRPRSIYCRAAAHEPVLITNHKSGRYTDLSQLVHMLIVHGCSAASMLLTMHGSVSHVPYALSHYYANLISCMNTLMCVRVAWRIRAMGTRLL
jgi:hypothetical protein